MLATQKSTHTRSQKSTRTHSNTWNASTEVNYSLILLTRLKKLWASRETSSREDFFLRIEFDFRWIIQERLGRITGNEIRGKNIFIHCYCIQIQFDFVQWALIITKAPSSANPPPRLVTRNNLKFFESIKCSAALSGSNIDWFSSQIRFISRS